MGPKKYGRVVGASNRLGRSRSRALSRLGMRASCCAIAIRHRGPAPSIERSLRRHPDSPVESLRCYIGANGGVGLSQGLDQRRFVGAHAREHQGGEVALGVPGAHGLGNQAGQCVAQQRAIANGIELRSWREPQRDFDQSQVVEEGMAQVDARDRWLRGGSERPCRGSRAYRSGSRACRRHHNGPSRRSRSAAICSSASARASAGATIALADAALLARRARASRRRRTGAGTSGLTP